MRSRLHQLKLLLLREGRHVLRSDRELRRRLWHHPFALAFIGGTGVILFWRGIWHIADVTPFLAHPLVSLLVGAFLLAVSGLFVLQLVGNASLQEQITDLKELERRIESEEREMLGEEKVLVTVETRLEQEIHEVVRDRVERV